MRKISIRQTSTIFSMLVALLVSTVAIADSPARRIQFARGSSGAIIKGRLVNTRQTPEAWQNYLLRVRRGQTLTIRLTSNGDRAGFRLTLPNGVLAEDDHGNAGFTEWSGRVPASGDCKIEVSHGHEVRATPYTLEVLVE